MTIQTGSGSAGRNPFEEALRQLVDEIHAGRLPAGTRLPPERELSEQLSIGRTTLRAVIRALQQAGYIQTQRGRSGGSVVVWEPRGDRAAPTALTDEMKTRLFDMLKFRSVLEPGSAGLAASRQLTEQESQALQDRLHAVASSGSDFRRADCNLHSYIADLSECHALVEAIANVQLILNESLLRVVPVMGPALEHSNEQHEMIVEAILKGDPDRARQVMSDHVEATAELVRGFLS
ncbi:FadR family transcriptional regulator [Rhodococcus sp. ABRD24]|uniref:FadR/GntR family transcriptional regulator n=1 Tax=Rhodococcus sp. ABRD24 TaxID=2507582 RepID=UPI00103F56F3|nr:FCD domain-containing protein [Rhodococcus sp. ABRD24]QBJ97197.1 FadR family transcriptional regulator [Rhodococcus sp. ABRD24]